ncbi:hypothetical protein VPHD51_0088 [Vibrio phage D51]
MKLKLNNRDKQVQEMLDWIMKNKLFHSITRDTKRVSEGYATYLAKQKCKTKYGAPRYDTRYHREQLERQKLFSIMTLNILCKLHSIPNNIGYVYIVSNPAWDGWYKVGAAKDAETRLLSYQTGTPFRDYKLEWYIPCEDYVKVEKEFHESNIFSHEWVQLPLSEIRQMLRSSSG